MPTLLDDRLVADALTALTGWSGDARQISRTVALDDARAEALLAEVSRTAAAMNHHPAVERAKGAVVLTLSTHSAGGVTEYDIALASRIDDLVLQVTGGGGTVAGAPTAAGSSAVGGAGAGSRQHGQPREGVDVPADAGATAERGERLAPADSDQGEPAVGAPAAQGTPGTPLPDTVPDAPQPGVGRPEGQGAPPAGQNVELPAERGGPGDRS